MKTHYELLAIEPTADADAIKKAFRREIARYHPDKVIHLGAEFQEMAATRAAELTVAYKTLTDPSLRQEYDASLAMGMPPHQPPPDPSPQDASGDRTDARAASIDQTIPEDPKPSKKDSRMRFAAVRADRDVILKRAIAGRVQGISQGLYGELETPVIRGFDFAIVPTAKARFLGAPPPRVLIRVLESVDNAAIIDAYHAAARARVHSGKSPVVVLLFARELAAQQEMSRANDTNARQPKAPDGPGEIAVIPVNTVDWSCRLPPNCSKEVQKLATALCAK